MTNEPDSYPKDSSPEARAKRIKYLRKKLALTQQEIEKKYPIPLKSLQNWERVRYSGLSEKGAERLAEVFISEGIQCAKTSLITWLLYGDGPNPISNHSYSKPKEGFGESLSEEAKIAQELQLFHSHHINALDATVMDHSFAPYLSPGDRVGGIRYSENIDRAIGVPAIIEISSGEILIRIVENACNPGYYNLTSPNSKVKTVPNTELSYVAPIIWIRKKPFN